MEALREEERDKKSAADLRLKMKEGDGSILWVARLEVFQLFLEKKIMSLRVFP